MSGAALVPISQGRFRLEGDLDFTSVVPLVAAPGRLFADTGALLVDLAGVEHTNSAGLALLLEWLGQARSRDRQLSFVNLPDSLQRLAELSNLEALIGAVADAPL